MTVSRPRICERAASNWPSWVKMRVRIGVQLTVRVRVNPASAKLALLGSHGVKGSV